VTYHAAMLTDILGRRNHSSGDAPKSPISVRLQRSAAISIPTSDRIILTGRAASPLISSSVD
jgi:hypothetical protein